MIVESLSLDNLVSILRWSGEAHGSAWVHRQALHFLREEFSQVISEYLKYLFFMLISVWTFDEYIQRCVI